jgi:hypothetical protein
MKLRVGKIPYTMKCEIDGCTANAEYAFDAESGRPAGRLHLCRECWSELVRWIRHRDSVKILLNQKIRGYRMAYINLKDELNATEYANKIQEDYLRRRQERMGFELQWQLNMNFVGGNQYCLAAVREGQIYNTDKKYEWEEREVFNHIAPIVEARLARLGRVRPTPVVRPATSEEGDEDAARVSTAILRAAATKTELSQKIEEATHWAELCGTAFYKVIWNKDIGRSIGKRGLKEGDIQLAVCPPFEIFPDDSACRDVEDCNSIIHAHAVSCDEAAQIWGVDEGEKVEVFSLDCLPLSGLNAKRTERLNHILVLEKYQRPNNEFPEGRLSIVAGKRLVYDGPLPYINEEDGVRGLPFVRQVCIESPGGFWGGSVVERCIPVQRAYNAVKNRKHEYLARAACGVLAVEEGAVDTTRLEDEGMEPGGIVVYRSGAPLPTYIEPIPFPSALIDEENALLDEFELISGVSEFARHSFSSASTISGVALELLNEQDDTRLAVTAEHIRNAVATISKQILRLYKQFAVSTRLERIVGDNGSIGVFKWNASMLNSYDVTHDTENELSQSVSERKKMVLELMARGLFTNDAGQMDSRSKTKILDMLGMGTWEEGQDINSMHIERAKRENHGVEEGTKARISEIDNHELHIAQHTKHMLSENFERNYDENIKNLLLEHIREHKASLNTESANN